MHPSLPRLAKNISKRPLNLREATAALLPPIPLYRGILRAHRYLPVEMRSLGDEYIKAEFRRHRDVTNPGHIIGFLSQWKVYLDQLPVGPDAEHFRGKNPEVSSFFQLSEEQLRQMYELMNATKDLWKPAYSNPDPDVDRDTR
ncbi:ACN9-domain-containing protein [Lactarius quietus]|nr:ACN9-domain-containing protein [Lactarius quietus]